MPAPIAKGIILLSSILVAAGIAVYENPEVRAWIQERRRRIVLTVNEIIDEFDQPRSNARRTHRTEDISTQEDDSAEAAERRRRARQEIMERGLLIDRKRREEHKRKESRSTFDEMVDDEGKLREKSDHAVATGAEDSTIDQSLRHRSNNTNAIAHGSAVANPFDDEMGGVINEKALIEDEQQSSAAPVLVAPLQVVTDLPTAAATQRDVNEDSHLTPTTSLATSTLLSATGVMTPTSADHSLLEDQDYVQPNIEPAPAQSYQSIQEWASAASSGPASFYSPPESERNFHNMNPNIIHTPSGASSKTASIIGTNEGASERGDLGVETLSDSGTDTPFTWSEVGSQVSGDD